ncbi:MAG: lipoprotein-releasing ABC transporter permease subunit [Gammaproteobacteria bacterium]
MFKPLEVFVGLRYTRARRRNHFISFISLSSMMGVALGVAALIIVLSVMNGFERELRQRILGMAAHATISGYGGTIADWPALAEQADDFEGVLATAPYVQGEAMLTQGRLVRGALVRGVEPALERGVLEIEQYMVHGSLDTLEAGKYNVVLGAVLARALGAVAGSKVTLVAPKANVSPAGVLPRLRRFTVTGIFEADHAQYDASVALVNIRDAARLFQLGGKVNGLRIKVGELFEAPRISRELANTLDGTFWVRDWTQMNANFFRALKTEKTVMFVILTLIVAVAAFNIVSTLIMVVTDKQADIAVLRTLGVTPFSVMMIFVVQGALIGLIGTLLGVTLGALIASNIETIVPWIEHTFSTKFLPPDIYNISEVPSDMRWPDVRLIAIVSFILTVVATLYPALRAARTQPAEALRYE